MHCANFPRHLVPDRPPSSRYDAISRLGLWRWTASDLASLEYHSPLSEVGIQPIGKRKTGKDGRPRLVWALRWRRCPSKRRSWRLPPTSATRALRRCLTAQSPDHKRRRSRSNTAPTRPPRALPGADHCAMLNSTWSQIGRSAKRKNPRTGATGGLSHGENSDKRHSPANHSE